VTNKGILFRLHNLCCENCAVLLTVACEYLVRPPRKTTFPGRLAIAGGNYNPAWVLNSTYTVADLESYLEEHITTAIRTVGPKSWVTDVVNEPFCNSASECDPANGNLKDMDPWYPKVADYLALAFTTARKAADAYAPHLKLFVNDYSLLTNSFKAERVIAGIKQLKAASVPIDGLGVQAHLGSSEPNGASWKQTLQSFKDLGVMTQITEMDTACGNPCEGDAAAKQAQVYGDVLTACLATKATSFGAAGCGAHVTWGFTDKYTWLNKNGKIVNPLPFDANYQPKPAAMEMLSVLQHWAAGIQDPTRPWAYE
jgi:endo-1,4-beta-xylanase